MSWLSSVLVLCHFVSGEILASPKQALFLDEISTGLDSSTTFLITKCLSNICHYTNSTMLISLLQVSWIQ